MARYGEITITPKWIVRPNATELIDRRKLPSTNQPASHNLAANWLASALAHQHKSRWYLGPMVIHPLLKNYVDATNKYAPGVPG